MKYVASKKSRLCLPTVGSDSKALQKLTKAEKLKKLRIYKSEELEVANS